MQSNRAGRGKVREGESREGKGGKARGQKGARRELPPTRVARSLILREQLSGTRLWKCGGEKEREGRKAKRVREREPRRRNFLRNLIYYPGGRGEQSRTNSARLITDKRTIRFGALLSRAKMRNYIAGQRLRVGARVCARASLLFLSPSFSLPQCKGREHAERFFLPFSCFAFFS